MALTVVVQAPPNWSGRTIPGVSTNTGRAYVLNGYGQASVDPADLPSVLELGFVTGIEPLWASTVGPHQASVVVPLLGGFPKYHLTVRQLLMNQTPATSGAHYVAFSVDGGRTFIIDGVNNDSYVSLISGLRSTIPTTVTVDNGTLPDAYINLTGVVDPPNSVDAVPKLVRCVTEMDIYPGDSTYLAGIDAVSSFMIDDGEGYAQYRSSGTLNPSATHAPTPQRATHLLIQPFGNADYPPTDSTVWFDSGFASLYGVAGL